MSNNLSKRILTTVTYYDVMDYPLTSFEIWKYLTGIKSAEYQIQTEEEDFSLLNILKELEGDKLKKFISEYRGYYFLKGRQELVEKRIERNKISESKYRILLRVARWLRWVPFVRMVAVTGRMAMKNAARVSDLDLLIVLKRGKIFTGRTLVTALTHILGRRRYGAKIANRVCLNYFITDESLEINLKDIFSASEYSFILPLFGWEVFQKFQRENEWIRGYKENFVPDELANRKLLPDTKWTKAIRKTGEAILDFPIIEKKLKAWQTARIRRDPRTHQKGSLIIASDEALVFLPEPQSPQVFEKFQERLNSLGES